MNLPSYDFIPAPMWLITSLHVVTLTLHFLAMNFVLGGAIALVFAGRSRAWGDPAVQRFVKALPSAMAATVTLGVAPLLFLQLVYDQQVYSASIVSAWWWLLIVAAVILAYYLFYGAAFATSKGRVGVLLGLALPFVLYVSFVYSTVFSMAERPDAYTELYRGDVSGWALNGDVTAWFFRWLHMIAGAVAVGGFFVGYLGRDSGDMSRVGRRFLLWGTVAAAVVGTAYLVGLSDYLVPFMRSVGIWLVLGGVVLALGALHLYYRERFGLAGLLLALSVLGMVGARHALRLIVLGDHFDPAATPVEPQWTVFGIFLVCFVAAIGVIAFMLKRFVSGRAPA